MEKIMIALLDVSTSLVMDVLPIIIEGIDVYKRVLQVEIAVLKAIIGILCTTGISPTVTIELSAIVGELEAIDVRAGHMIKWLNTLMEVFLVITLLISPILINT